MGKEKCEQLREIRKEIAERNNIEFEPAECDHEGPCSGTCPACDAELGYLDRMLAEKQERGEEVVLDGISAGHIVESITIPCPVGRVFQDSSDIVSPPPGRRKAPKKGGRGRKETMGIAPHDPGLPGDTRIGWEKTMGIHETNDWGDLGNFGDDDE